jgi:hypothetical protein
MHARQQCQKMGGNEHDQHINGLERGAGDCDVALGSTHPPMASGVSASVCFHASQHSAASTLSSASESIPPRYRSICSAKNGKRATWSLAGATGEKEDPHAAHLHC